MTGKLRIAVRDSKVIIRKLFTKKHKYWQSNTISVEKTKLDIIGGLNEPMKLDGLK